MGLFLHSIPLTVALHRFGVPSFGVFGAWVLGACTYTRLVVLLGVHGIDLLSKWLAGRQFFLI